MCNKESICTDGKKGIEDIGVNSNDGWFKTEYRPQGTDKINVEALSGSDMNEEDKWVHQRDSARNIV